jgi:hypothetical protein
MPRPLLEIWRDLNRDRDRGPSSLLRQPTAKLAREMASPEYQARTQLRRALEPKPMSLVQRAIRELGSPENQEKWRKRQEFLKAVGVTQRLLGTPVPVQPDKPTQPMKRKRAPGAGRHPALKQEQIDKGLGIVRNNPTMLWKQLRWALREAGINAGDTTLNTRIIRPARGLP